MDFDALLESATPQTADVALCVDGAMQAQLGDLAKQWEAAVKDADDRLGMKSRADALAEQIVALRQEMSDRVVTIRIRQMPGTAWAALKVKHPVGKSPGAYDKANGYNVEAVCRKALLSHAGRVDGDTVVPLSTDQWQKLFDTISGGDFESLILSTLSVNQLAGQMSVANLVKGSRTISSSATN